MSNLEATGRTGTLVAINSHAGIKIRVCGCAGEPSYCEFMLKKKKKSQNANTSEEPKMSQISAITALALPVNLR